jgi:hypothetical protein
MSKKGSINSGAWSSTGVGCVTKEGLRSSYAPNAADKMQAVNNVGEPSFILISDSHTGLNEPTRPGGVVPIQAPDDGFNTSSAPAAFIFHPGHNCHLSNTTELNDAPKVIGAADLALMSALTQLPPGHWQVFTLHDVQGYEHIESAALWGVSIGNS